MNGIVTITIAGLIAGVLITITAPPMAAVIMVWRRRVVCLGVCHASERRLGSGEAEHKTCQRTVVVSARTWPAR